MAWLAVDEDGAEFVYNSLPIRGKERNWWCVYDSENDYFIELPKGSIEKLIGRKLTWEDEPVELTENN